MRGCGGEMRNWCTVGHLPGYMWSITFVGVKSREVKGEWRKASELLIMRQKRVKEINRERGGKV